MNRPDPSVAPAEAKACCAAVYGSDLVALLLGDSYHPGGLALTRRMADRLALRAGATVLDVASGRGATALLLSGEYRTDVTGIDLSAANVAAAVEAAERAGLAGRIRFRLGDAERLPVPDAAFDAAVCECAFCTFPDKGTAAAELARVLRPGGRLGLTDVTVDPRRLPAELAGLGGWIACVADARPLDGYAEILAGAGLRVIARERHDTAVATMLDRIDARLALIRLTARDRAEAAGLDFNRAPALLAAARAAVGDGAIGYGLLVAARP
ncbi:class I SAM-dependent methyltransferase [Micromonospora sp. MS34]|uniref:class I SAM-dependent methyltransferase n=1 Tax=Micromonospora sp. MS34 TaxID=3385971 RepID=UPI0039A01485